MRLAKTNTEDVKVQIDYTQLRNLLKKAKWQDADTETWNISVIAFSGEILV